jgi:hypothetical protein
MEWTFRLRGPKGKNGVLKMSPTATLEDFEGMLYVARIYYVQHQNNCSRTMYYSKGS